jgi:hypothetical protein
VSTTLSCGQCGAALRSDQSWCSLCYAHIPDEFDPLTAPLDEVIGHHDMAIEPESAVLPPDPSSVPDMSREAAIVTEAEPLFRPESAASDLDGAVELSDVEVMLSMLAAEHKAMDPAAGLMDRFGDKSTRVAIMVGGTVVIGALLFIGLTVLGAIF